MERSAFLENQGIPSRKDKSDLRNLERDARKKAEKQETSFSIFSDEKRQGLPTTEGKRAIN